MRPLQFGFPPDQVMLPHSLWLSATVLLLRLKYAFSWALADTAKKSHQFSSGYGPQCIFFFDNRITGILLAKNYELRFRFLQVIED